MSLERFASAHARALELRTTLQQSDDVFAIEKRVHEQAITAAREARAARDALAERAAEEKSLAIEAVLLGELRAGIEPIVASFCDEPTRGHARAFCDAWCPLAVEYQRTIGRPLPLRHLSLALLEHLRPGEVRAFAHQGGAWCDATGASAPQAEFNLEQALQRGDVASILDALIELERTVTLMKGHAMPEERKEHQRARWELMRATSSPARLEAFDRAAAATPAPVREALPTETYAENDSELAPGIRGHRIGWSGEAPASRPQIIDSEEEWRRQHP